MPCKVDSKVHRTLTPQHWQPSKVIHGLACIHCSVVLGELGCRRFPPTVDLHALPPALPSPQLLPASSTLPAPHPPPSWTPH